MVTMGKMSAGMERVEAVPGSSTFATSTTLLATMSTKSGFMSSLQNHALRTADSP